MIDLLSKFTYFEIVAPLAFLIVLSWLYVFITSRTRFRVSSQSLVAWMSRNSLLEAGAEYEV